MATVKVYLTDKSKKQYFVELVSPHFVDSAIRGLKNHLAQSKIKPNLYSFIDLKTAEIKTEIIK